MAGWDRCGIGKGDPRVPVESLKVKEEYTAPRFYEMVVRCCMGKSRTLSSLNAGKVIVLEITESAEMEQKYDSHYLAVG